MKNALLVFFGLALVLIASCSTLPATVDMGAINTGELSGDDLVTLHIAKYVDVSKIDNIEVNWTEKSGYQQTVTLAPGLHTFAVKFNDGRRCTLGPSTVTGVLEKGNTYLLKNEVDGFFSSYHIRLYNDKIGTGNAKKS